MSEYMQKLRARIGHDLIVAPSVAAIISDEEGRILLLRHSEGNRWVVPGGAVEPGETPADALVREVEEEAGLQVIPTEVLAVYGGAGALITYQNGDQVSYVMLTFRCDVKSGIAQADGVETLEAGYFTLPEALDLDLAVATRQMIEVLLEGDLGVWFQPTTIHH